MPSEHEEDLHGYHPQLMFSHPEGHGAIDTVVDDLSNDEV